jgi:hypothetical protein
MKTTLTTFFDFCDSCLHYSICGSWTLTSEGLLPRYTENQWSSISTVLDFTDKSWDQKRGFLRYIWLWKGISFPQGFCQTCASFASVMEITIEWWMEQIPRNRWIHHTFYSFGCRSFYNDMVFCWYRDTKRTKLTFKHSDSNRE